MKNWLSKSMVGFLATVSLFALFFWLVPVVQASDDATEIATMTTGTANVTTNTATTTIAANGKRNYLYIYNTSTNAMWVAFGTNAPAASKGIHLAPGGTVGDKWETYRPFLCRQAVKIINADAGVTNVIAYAEGVGK